MAGSAWAVKAADSGHDRAEHSYDRHKQEQAAPEVLLPEIIHNPPLQISSTEDFNINAKINNIGLGIPIIYYRFDGNKNYFKRAMHGTKESNCEFKILSAALTGDQLDYYIEVATGSEVLATLGSQDNPIKVRIIAPKHNTVILYLAIGTAIAGLIARAAISSIKKAKAIKAKEKAQELKTAPARKKRQPQLSARAR